VGAAALSQPQVQVHCASQVLTDRDDAVAQRLVDGQLRRPPGWFWVYCTRYHPLCQHRAPMAIAPLIIRWGPDVSDVLRR
jgi:hypothetical protein